MSKAIKHLYLSSISNGEPIAGFFYRSQFGFGRSLQQELWKAIGKTYSGKISWLLPSSLNLIAEIFGDATGDTKSILEKNTLFPVFCRFLSQENRHMLEQHHCFNTGIGIGSILGFYRLNRPGRVFNVCKKCLTDDISSDGRSFWRREFMMPAIEFCWKHREPLQAGCSTCVLDYGKPESILYTGKNCTCDVNRNLRLSTYTDDDVISLVDLSLGFSRLLDPKILTNVKFDDFKSAIANRSVTLGLTRNGMMNQARVIEFFDDNKLVSSRDKRVMFGISWLMLRQALTGQGLPANPISSIRLLSVLFGGWPEAENYLLNASNRLIISDKLRLGLEESSSNQISCRRKRKRRPVAIREERFLECVQAYRAVRDGFATETHSELLRRLPSSFRLYLTRKRLMLTGERMPLTNKGEEYYKSLDISFEKHILNSRSLLRSTSYSPRISKNILLKGHRMASVWSRINVSLPLSKKALAESEETFSDYRKRKLKELVVNREESAIQSAAIDVIDRLDDTEVFRLLRIARKKKVM